MHKKIRILRRASRTPLQAAFSCGSFLIAGTAIIVNAAAAHADDNIEYLKSLKIEDLLRAEIASVSKKPEKLAAAAAAVFVITAADIEWAGARSIPEALRMAPGLQVAQLSANKWLVSARGLGDLFSNKLLVMIDGRSIYPPLISGVFWDNVYKGEEELTYNFPGLLSPADSQADAGYWGGKLLTRWEVERGASSVIFKPI